MQVLSSLSGLTVYSPSAGYAPTNSADVSAIASAYQVVSATATQLYAGTAYVTSVNEIPVSAARAGNAANASLATSAYYDGTGRLISSLPDEAIVSSIASAYAESAASSKLDESATAAFYPTSNPSGFISGVDLSDYATTAYVDSSISSFVDSSYVESQVSGKQDTLTFDWDADSAISSINGSALAGGGGGGGIVTATGTATAGDTAAPTTYVTSVNGIPLSAANDTIITAEYTEVIIDSNLNTSTATSTGTATALQTTRQSAYTDAAVKKFILSTETGDKYLPIEAGYISTGALQQGTAASTPYKLAFSPAVSFWPNGQPFSQLQYATGACISFMNGYFNAYMKGNETFVSDDRYGYARTECHNNRGCHFIGSSLSGAAIDVAAKGSAAYLSLTGATKNLGYSTAYLNQQQFYIKDSANKYVVGMDGITASGPKFYLYNTADSAYKYIYPTSIDHWNAKLDTSAIECDTASAITAIGGSSVGCGVDEATVSAIASAYQVVSSVGDDGTYITSINGSALSGVGGGGTSDPFPYVIQSGTNQRAVLLTAFQDNNANRPTLMLSGYKSSNGKWPRMMVTDYNGTTGFTHSGVLLANAYETYIGTALAGESGLKTFRMDEYSMDFLPFRVWNTSTNDWYTADLERCYYHTASYTRSGMVLSASENSGENEMYTQFSNSGLYMSSTDYAYLDTGVTASGMSATATASAELNIDTINSWNGKQDSSAMTAYVEKTAYDNLYSAFTALSDIISTYSGYFSSISAKVDNSAIGVE